MITTAPLPGWVELLALRFLTAPDGAALARPWRRDGDLGALWLSRSAWSLAAIADAWAAANGRAPLMALPDYICAGSLGPLRQGRAELAFFPVDGATLAPAGPLPACDILVAVHYFGRPADLASARAHCDATGALLVEDCAHVLRPQAGIGEAGDVALYSPHKLLAVPDGAVMVVRPGAARLEGHLGKAVAALGWSHPPTAGWRLKRLIQKSPAGPLLARLKPGGQPDFASDPAPGALAATAMPSPAGAALIARADLDALSRRRRANADALSVAIVALAQWEPLFPPGGWTPYRLVMRCASHRVAAGLYARLRAAGLPVESWPDLPPEAAPGSSARDLRATLLLLPCHQSLDPETLAAAYARALKGAP
ncbi:DegT/DnrJ/EryC1/StrS family aminotransferase [Magnetospirillum sp. UT-4]|uniref:DegT/DnrJ/EryC1/StrS family aminotransferase n=1 Tax=Magnetospirillum sp. UT-4 TaxID=2681467 RepID=UPI001385CE69|nr:DegT/DnrJ/EryC1/StrS family aminotransferase [Magnetospirillum sp. UT-4]CAA7621703.1 conserved hypothetical protein [Magnetospirillum sp. UT-4]